MLGRIAICFHRPELEEGKSFAIEADSFLLEKYWSRGSSFDGCGNYKKKRKEAKQ
jgi:hypothetical protein